MKCIKRTLSVNGKLPNFVEDECDIPTILNSHEIKVQVKVCGLSLVDEKILHDLYKKSIKEEFPLGHDVAGIVVDIGEAVTHVNKGDHVVGILPLDSKYSGCGEYCIFQEYNVVRKPHHLSFEEAAASIGDCVKAYTALYYLGRVGVGDTVLVIDGATHFGSITIQIAQHWGAKVIATYSSSEEKQYLDTLQPIQTIELNKKNNVLASNIREETGGIGLNCIIDNGVRLFTDDEDITLCNEVYKYPLPHKHDVISCLGFSGRWITSKSDLQLDPPDCQQLFYRGASLSFLFHHSWILTNCQQGKYQHVLKDSMKKIADGIIKCKITETVKFDNVMSVLKNLPNQRVGKTILTF
ncbi:hypothetical protein LOTGIDRAFT_210251 [Lottia gigantea]|uniref:Enoyl reductase (ER) domain-containing protein n=1 Tax=Lottia gigantea TaxID=225164 RepID=V3ZDP1_LOTGI|nr:hypothetical protein LOTGIDRAFT_210251 [Lottia gigantea]ESO89238.1 hypothetical protein LOTGIDRAFT_210251 [Lottia gigantea]